MSHRLFISIKISEQAREELRRVQEELKRKNQQSRITWVDPAVMHLTLHFLGDCEDTKMEEIKKVLEAVSHPPLPPSGRGGQIARLTLHSLDVFPSSLDPRVIVVKTSDKEGRLADLQKKIGQELSAAGFVIDPRPFRCHITLGRVRSQSGEVKGLEMPVAPIAWEVKSVELMESRLTTEGPIYQEVCSVSFPRKRESRIDLN